MTPKPEYKEGTVKITLYPGPECDIDALHEAADRFGARVAEENHVFAEVVRQERSDFKPDKEDNE